MNRGMRLLALLVIVAVALSACGGKRKKKGAAEPVEGLTGGVLVFSDDFERETLGDQWTARSGKWDLRDGWLHCSGDRNEGAWLNTPLPERVRVEFDARSLSDAGDLKFEIFATDQRHQAGYIVILGGWNNSVSIIARLDEHGEDRLEAGQPVVTKGKVHHFTVLRTDGVLRWYVDGQPVLSYRDEDPIRGRFFGFNDWAADVYFDNLQVFRL